MYNVSLAYVVSFLAMAMVMSSYFFKKKSMYLMFQFLGIVFLIFSYFFTLEFVAMIGLIVGLFRTLIFYLYERKEKPAPIWLPFVLSGFTIIAFFIGNFLKGSSAVYYDIIYILALCLFAFIFRIRDLRLVRFLCLIPLVLSVLYNILISAPIFNTLSYSFELLANVASIIAYYVIYNKKTVIKFKKENTDEKN